MSLLKCASLNTKYTGTKRFGLDGAEAIVPALEAIIKRGGALGIEEIVIGMPHRGRQCAGQCDAKTLPGYLQ